MEEVVEAGEEVANVGKGIIKGTGRFLYETGKGIVKGVYNVGKGLVKGISKGVEDGVVAAHSGDMSVSADDIPESKGKYSNGNYMKKDFYDFLNSLKEANIPARDYHNLASLVGGESYIHLSDADRIEKSLSLLDKMCVDNYINKRTHKRLKKSLYRQFERTLKGKKNSGLDSMLDSQSMGYVPLTASFIFFFVGILLLTPVLMGFSILEGVASYKLNLIGIVCFFLEFLFLGFL